MIILVGAGYMAIEYAKVLKAMKLPFITIGRGEASAKSFSDSTGTDVITGGLRNWLKNEKIIPTTAIIAVSVDQLADSAEELIKCGTKLILLEKPGGLDAKEILSVAKASAKHKAKVHVAYNRRFYASVVRAMEIIKQDRGVKSFLFEFTEWSHQIVGLNMPPSVKRNWFMANSTHVVDLAFFLGGKPKQLESFKSGNLKWHPSGSIYSGAGISDTGALFSYSANWESPGRWSLEILTQKSRLIFKPLEKLQIQKTGSVTVEEIKINDDLDKKFKPGLYLQVKSFLSDKHNLLTIDQQVKNLKYYNQILNGS